MILFPLAILISGRSGGNHYNTALRRDRLFSVTLTGAVGFLNLTRAIDELQSCSAQQSDSNHQERQSPASRRLRSICYLSWDLKTRTMLMF
eukprot:5274292-Pyramimonas_sp.AAC.1